MRSFGWFTNYSLGWHFTNDMTHWEKNDLSCSSAHSFQQVLDHPALQIMCVLFPKVSESILDAPTHDFSTSSPLPWFTAEYTCLGGWIITACTNSYFHQLGERRVLDFTFIGQMHFPLIAINVLSHWQNCGDILSLHDPFTKGANDKRCQHPKLNIFDPFTKGGGVSLEPLQGITHRVALWPASLSAVLLLTACPKVSHPAPSRRWEIHLVNKYADMHTAAGTDTENIKFSLAKKNIPWTSQILNFH